MWFLLGMPICLDKCLCEGGVGSIPPLARRRAVMKDLLPNRLSAWKLGDGTIAFVLQRIPWGLLCTHDEHMYLSKQRAD